MEVIVDFSSFLDIEMKVGNKVELRSDDWTFKGIIGKEQFEDLISRYLNAVDIETVKAFIRYAEEIVKEEEKEAKKDENIIEEIISQKLQGN